MGGCSDNGYEPSRTAVPTAMTAHGHRRHRRSRIRSRSRRSSTWSSSSPDPRSGRRNRHRRHTWQRAVPLGRALFGDQRSAPEGVGRLGAMRAWGGRAATVGPVEEGEGRRPCLASAHAACPSPCRGDDGAGRGPAAGDAPERGCRSLATRGIPEDGWSSTTAAARRRHRRLSRGRRPVKGVVDAIGFGGATGGHRRRCPLPPTRDRADGTGPAGTRSYETPF